MTPSSSWTRLLPLALFVAVLAVYWPVRTHDFVSYDDEVYLLSNPHVTRGLVAEEVVWVFTHKHAANYHPLTWVSHMLDVELFGMEPGAHHVVNAVLHALNTVLVFGLARAMFGGPWLAALAAALFGLHPLRVESVAWASERKDVLCGLFFLAGLLAYLRYARAPSPWRYLVVCLFSALALLSKPMAVTFPCVALLLDVWPLGRLWPARTATTGSTRRVLLEKLPLLALAAGGALTTWIAQEVGGATSSAIALPFHLRALNALVAYGVYLRQTFWPAGLSVFYPLVAVTEKDPLHLLLGPAALSGLMLAAVSLLAWRLRARAPWLAVGWAWFLGTLVPAIGLKQVGTQAHADRYTYLPLLGVTWIVVGALQALVRERTRLRTPLCVAASASVLALGCLARRQVEVWRDTPTLFTHALAIDPRNYLAHTGMGAWYYDHDEPERAGVELETALQIHPLDVAALTYLARIALDRGEPDQAEKHLALAVRIQASRMVRYQLGRLRLQQHDLEGAAREFQQAVALDPSMVDARFNLGNVLYQLQRKDEAREEFERASALDPRHAGALNGRGVLALERGDAAGAEELFRRAFELDPRYADAVGNLGVALERLGRAEEARQCYQEARRLRAR